MAVVVPRTDADAGGGGGCWTKPLTDATAAATAVRATRLGTGTIIECLDE